MFELEPLQAVLLYGALSGDAKTFSKGLVAVLLVDDERVGCFPQSRPSALLPISIGDRGKR